MNGVNTFPLTINCLRDEMIPASYSVNAMPFIQAETETAGSLLNPVDPNALPVQPGEFATSTPELDGSIYHVVQVNETLWSIAVNYGKTIAEIQALNGMGDSIDVAVGQRILIVYGGTPVADTATPTQTPLPATNTPKPSSTPTETAIPLPTLTPTITMTATPEPLIRHINYFDTPGSKTFGLILMIVCLIGLTATLFFGFIRKK